MKKRKLIAPALACAALGIAAPEKARADMTNCWWGRELSEVDPMPCDHVRRTDAQGIKWDDVTFVAKNGESLTLRIALFENESGEVETAWVRSRLENFNTSAYIDVDGDARIKVGDKELAWKESPNPRISALGRRSPVGAVPVSRRVAPRTVEVEELLQGF